MKRKNNDEQKKKKKVRVIMREGQLRTIFNLIESGHTEQAMNLIPPEIRHRPLSVHPSLFDMIQHPKEFTQPLLHHAANHGNCTILNYLLDGGANIELIETKASRLSSFCSYKY